MVVCPYFIDTGMFEGVRTRFPLILPILKPQYVADKVLDGIEKGKKQLILPHFLRILPVLRALPVSLFDKTMNFLGVNRSMDHFVGRK